MYLSKQFYDLNTIQIKMIRLKRRGNDIQKKVRIFFENKRLFQSKQIYRRGPRGPFRDAFFSEKSIKSDIYAVRFALITVFSFKKLII